MKIKQLQFDTVCDLKAIVIDKVKKQDQLWQFTIADETAAVYLMVDDKDTANGIHQSDIFVFSNVKCIENSDQLILKAQNYERVGE